MSGEGAGAVDERMFVFNVVWTGRAFDVLEPLVLSQVIWSQARFRFIANACEPGQLEALERFSAEHPGRVVEVTEVSVERMIRHGDALDSIFKTRDDGELFCFIDPDVVACGPFLPFFRSVLERSDAVTSGREVWSQGNVRPAEHPGVNGEYFFDQDGFTFGSPHIAVYRRSVVTETMARWSVGFSSAGNDLPESTRQKLDVAGRLYRVYDTGKVLNVLLQLDGYRLRHEENPALIHIGGVSHHLAPPSSAPAARGKPPAWGEGPDWGQFPGMADRFEVARYTSRALEHLKAGRAAPDLPNSMSPAVRQRMEPVRATLAGLFADREGAASRPSAVGP